VRALTLHLIATHHGNGRPFAPVVEDDSPPNVNLLMQEKNVLVTTTKRLAHPAHALGSGVVERFWKLTRHHGWWGLVLLEAVLRLADQQASANSRPPSDDEH
jgi:CRISPR-associated endonuclease/helicase Cas3